MNSYFLLQTSSNMPVATGSHTQLVWALKKANAAVNADLSGDYAAAVDHYQQCLDGLDEDGFVEDLNDDDREKVVAIMSNYRGRVDTILAHIPELMRQSVPPWGMKEVNVNSFQRMEPCPIDPGARTYWLMRTLSKTMTTGGWLSDTLYIPRDLW
jgi:hypothetical protein